MGKRLGALTQNNTKCMVKVNGVSLIERLLHQLDSIQTCKLTRVVIVTGYEGQKLRDFISTLKINIKVEFVDNPIYATTNNIYSLWLAKDYLLEDDTLLFESDLIFESSLIEKLLQFPYPSLALVSKYESWMDGTVVKLGEDYEIEKFIPGTEFRYEDRDSYYKTVNIYKFSKQFSQTHYIPFLEAYSKALGNNEYYEQVLRVITLLDKPEIKALPLNGESWYEIDDIQDLDIAESIFCSPEERFSRMEERQGGYWRYPQILDFSTPNHPYFPNDRLKSELRANYDHLICAHPSGQTITGLLAGKCCGVDRRFVCVGNGVSELAQAALKLVEGQIGLIVPGYETYTQCVETSRLTPMDIANADLSYSAEDIMTYYESKEINSLLLINPDNPRGNYVARADLDRLCDWAQKKGIRLFLDETFSDFTNESPHNTLFNTELLLKNPNLIVLKSIDNAQGIPGLKLGILATSDIAFISKLQKQLPPNNINAIGEFYMQIFGKYEKHYLLACKAFLATKERFAQQLNNSPCLKVIPSQGNFLFCKVLPPYTATQLAGSLLEEHNILVFDCSKIFNTKNGEYIRISIRDDVHNEYFVNAVNQASNNIKAPLD